MSLTETREMFAMLKREKKCRFMIMRDARNSKKAYSVQTYSFINMLSEEIPETGEKPCSLPDD